MIIFEILPGSGSRKGLWVPTTRLTCHDLYVTTWWLPKIIIIFWGLLSGIVTEKVDYTKGWLYQPVEHGYNGESMVNTILLLYSRFTPLPLLQCLIRLLIPPWTPRWIPQVWFLGRYTYYVDVSGCIFLNLDSPLTFGPEKIEQYRTTIRYFIRGISSQLSARRPCTGDTLVCFVGVAQTRYQDNCCLF